MAERLSREREREREREARRAKRELVAANDALTAELEALKAELEAERAAAATLRMRHVEFMTVLMSKKLKAVSAKSLSLSNGSVAEDDEEKMASILEALCKLPLNLQTYQWLEQNKIGYVIRDIAQGQCYNTVPERLRKLAQDVEEHWGHYIVSLFPNEDA